MKAVVVLSGGMDSTAALAWTIKQGFTEVECLSFWYGSKHNDREWVSAQAVAAHYGVSIKRARLDFIADTFKSDLLQSGGDIPEGHYADASMKKTVVPFRNGIMLSIAAGFAESQDAEAVVIGNHFGDHAIYPDCRATFITAISDAVSLGTYKKIAILSPFCFVAKGDIVKFGISRKVPFHLTYSCYNGGEVHCGKCGTCVERKEAFEGFEDPTIYAL